MSEYGHSEKGISDISQPLEHDPDVLPEFFRSPNHGDEKHGITASPHHADKCSVDPYYNVEDGQNHELGGRGLGTDSRGATPSTAPIEPTTRLSGRRKKT